MARQPVTRLSRSGQRFLIRRTMHALVRGDARMIDDPLREQSVSFAAGCVVTVLALVVSAVLVLVRPGSAPGDAPILLARNSGALYVRIGDTVHPVLNLASARLIVQNPADPVAVDDAAINAAPRGPLVGIPGAPARIDPPLRAEEVTWTLCEDPAAESTTLITGRSTLTPLRRGRALLVAARGAVPTYLLFDGRKALVDLREAAVVRALRLEGVAPIEVSQALLDSVPEAPGVRAPAIPGAGGVGPAALGGLPVGTVVRVSRAAGDDPDRGDEFLVVLTGGLQRVDGVVADLIRFSYPQPAGEPPLLPADVIAGVPHVENLAAPAVPHGMSQRVSVLCAAWDPRGRDHSSLLVGEALAEPALELAQADSIGPNIDEVGVPAGRSALIEATGLAGGHGPLYLLTDRGVLHGIHDAETARHLGLADSAVPAPWAMLAMLPRGPELSSTAASFVRDALAPAS
ncbi:type VII secretion protein EccB [Mycolicibacterium goodii]|uniref:Type VII secretion protein n=1 Tax=Mycolicibacterium goodii TaxID=134601 RepID=A0A0K0XE04_MYCGD|nr:type VII secretion protein [Mycolicibacterium goodii]